MLFDFQRYIVKVLGRNCMPSLQTAGLEHVYSMRMGQSTFRRFTGGVINSCAVGRIGLDDYQAVSIGILKLLNITGQVCRCLHYELRSIRQHWLFVVCRNRTWWIIHFENFEGKIRNKIIGGFGSQCGLSWWCTATPSPNDPMELGNHSEFLNAMVRNEMLSMYFVHDAGENENGDWRNPQLKSFMIGDPKWAVMLAKPSDIGFNAKRWRSARIESDWEANWNRPKG